MKKRRKSEGGSRKPAGVIRHTGPRTLHSFGFTLLEVIIALGLTLLLLSAVYGAIQLQYRVSTAGREEMLRAQVVRATLGMIEADVRAVVWQVQELPAEESDTTTTEAGGTGEAVADGQSTDDTTEILSTDDAFASGSSGIFGDSQSLVLHVSRPSRDLVYARSDEDAAESISRSDLASVTYFLADASSGGLSAAIAQQTPSGSSTSEGIVGLARVEGDRLSIEQAGDQAAVESLSTTQTEVVPEIVSIEFAYWDGLEWLDSWDSNSSGTLPSAIGITLEIDATSDAGDRTRAELIRTDSQSESNEDAGMPVVVQYVIAVPLAEPYVGEVSF